MDRFFGGAARGPRGSVAAASFESLSLGARRSQHRSRDRCGRGAGQRMGAGRQRNASPRASRRSLDSGHRGLLALRRARREDRLGA